MKLFKSLREVLSKVFNMCQCLISSWIEKKMDALKYWLASLLQMMLVLVLFIVLLDLVRKIIKYVWDRKSLSQIIQLFLWMKMETLQKKFPLMKECMFEMQTSSSSNNLKKEEELLPVKQKNTIILSVGEVILPLSTKLFPLGSSRSPLSKTIFYKIIWKQLGFQRTFKKKDSQIG